MVEAKSCPARIKLSSSFLASGLGGWKPERFYWTRKTSPIPVTSTPLRVGGPLTRPLRVSGGLGSGSDL